MPASAQGSAEAAPSSSPGLAAVGAAAASSSSLSASSREDGALPVVGERWRAKYDIVEQVSENDAQRVWRGKCVEGGQAIILRAFQPTEPEVRSQVWAKAGGIDSPHIQHPRQAHQVGEWRVEVANEPVGVPLKQWRATRPSVDADTVKAVVAQLAEALAALHAFELVHLGLRSESVYVSEAGATLQCMIAGLDALTTFDRKQSIPAAVDPFHAPPEALGLNVHVPGPAMCAWDWWSLGRVTQELVLGRHIVAHIANADVHEANPILLARAEELLQEADPKAPRAGGVEAMPRQEPALQLLLRGLLTSSKDARWTGDNVDRWVRGLPVKEHYNTPRVETHFRWRGRPYTVPEVAAILQSADSWAENNIQLFESSTPGTLAHFLRWSTAQTPAHEQLHSALELAEALPLKLSSPAAQREAVIMVALVLLSAGRLTWRGRTFESATVGVMLDELGAADAVMVLRALSTRSTAMQIERTDQAGGRLLTELGRTVGDVESLLKRYGWISATDLDGAARLHRLALEPVPALTALRDVLAQKFAGSDHPAMEKLFKAPNVGRSELVALAWVSSVPERCKFYTHAEAARRRAEALRARGVELTDALTWAQFERALQVGRTVFAGWGWFILTWFVFGVGAAVLWPGPRGLAFSLVPVGVAFAFRLLIAPRQQRALRDRVADAKWTWRDGPARCRRELRIAGRNVARATLEAELENVKKELGTLKDVKPAPTPLIELPNFRFVRYVGAGSWLLVIAFAALGGWRMVTHPPSAKELKAAWTPATDAKPKAEVAVAKDTDKEEGEVKVSWPFKPGEDAPKLVVRSALSATAAQITYATKHGRDLVKPYRPESISTLIIMPVPAGDDAAVMLFDGKRGELVNQQLYVLEFRPIPRSWVELAGRRGVFLDH